MKVLIWNIKFFSKTRITGQTATDGKTALENAIRTTNDAQRALQTLTYIRTTVQLTDPDVFVVVEPRSNAGDPGTLADPDSGGPAGLITLLASLRADLSDQWWLVPPQRINATDTSDPIDPGSPYTECIGVFWRADRMTFTGPWVNTADGPRAAGTAAAYTGSWANVVPVGTTAAGTVSFTYNNEEIGFPDATSRRPFLTSFTEIGGNQRLLDLYSLHMDTYRGGEALDRLARIPFRDQNKRVSLLCGDFNVDVRAMSTTEATSLAAWKNIAISLFPNTGKTHYVTREPILWPTVVYAGQTAVPGGYLKTATYDWGLVRYPNQGSLPTQLPTCQLIDRVAGQPVARAMSNALSDFTRTVDPLPVETFRGRTNYGKIGPPAMIESSPTVLADGTSDHLPILLTV